MSSYLVSGAGEPGVNGYYAPDGDYDGKPSYRLDATHYLWWYGSGGWILSAAKGDLTSYYGVSSTADTPPSSGWGATGKALPTPTVTEQATPFSIYPTHRGHSRWECQVQLSVSY